MHSHLRLALILVGSLACKPSSAPAQHPKTASPESEPAPSPEPASSGDSELTPTLVCDRAAAMVARYVETHDEEVRAQSREDCIAAASDDLARLGPEKFRAQAECMVAATSPKALRDCQRLEQRELEALCVHVFPLLFLPPDSPSTEELPPQALMICVEAMAKEREQLGPERFDAMRTCMLRASTTDQVTACAPE